MLKTLNSLGDKISPGILKMATDNNGNKIQENANLILSNYNNNHCHHNNHHISMCNGGTYVNGLANEKMSLPEQPDPDFIKMFVGQIPRSMDEADLTKMFSEYGRVYNINVLRDKVTGQSKGCCFVSFFTRKAALDAQNALHNIKTLTGMHHPIQMKPADSENRNERKLFVGMLSKKYSENDVRQMFQIFGTIEECTVLRDTSSISKGCAFVTFTSKQCAINAIKAMHHSQTMEGCSSPLVVKFADTQKEKDQKRLQQMQANLWNIAPQSYLASLNQMSSNESCLSPIQILQQQLQGTSNGNSLGGLLLHNSHQTAESPSNYGGMVCVPGIAALNGSSPTLSDISPTSLHNLATLANLNAVNPMSMQNLVTLAAMTGAGTMSPTALSGLANSNAAAILSGGGGGIPTLNSLTGGPLALSDTYQQIQVGSSGKQLTGPDGANLFIYHLPQEFSDADLASMFSPFGTVISAKVFIDKQNNRSKCFGFVSYDNPLSAQSAISSMHGFQIGTKRLKVQLKRSKDNSRPY